jgi:hypothetical protein
MMKRCSMHHRGGAGRRPARTLLRGAFAAAVFALCLGAAASPACAGELKATFIQLNRASAINTVTDWEASLRKIRDAGLDTIIVQWTADDGLAYFESELPYRETFNVVERMLTAASGKGLKIHLGLVNDPTFWTQITARDRVLRDYFLARITQHLRVQKELLRKFNGYPEWVGYYVPDEIDDLTWRHENKQDLLQDYLRGLLSGLRKSDSKRTVGISSFFRARTAPDIYAGMLKQVVSGFDQVMVQDGVGVGNPPPRYVPLYFKHLRETWPADGPALWCVVEAFRQVAHDSQTFTAVPAAPDALAHQVEEAAPYFAHLVLFSFLDYADPARGAEAARLFEYLKKR